VATLYLLLPLAAGYLYVHGGLDFRSPAVSLDNGRPYTVAALDAQLARGSLAWAGHVVQVRAIAEPCSVWGSPHDALHCRAIRPALADPDESDLADPLPLATGPQSPLLDLARGLPFIGQFIPHAPDLPWGALRIYQVRLHVAVRDQCGLPACAEAEVLAVTS
jgi:hypothetical protein